MIVATTVVHVAHTSQFWPTVGRVGTVVAAIAGTYAGFKSRGAQKHTLEVKSIVNGNFTEKVEQVTDVTKQLKDVTGQLAASQAALAALTANVKDEAANR